MNNEFSDFAMVHAKSLIEKSCTHGPRPKNHCLHCIHEAFMIAYAKAYEFGKRDESISLAAELSMDLVDAEVSEDAEIRPILAVIRERLDSIKAAAEAAWATERKA